MNQSEIEREKETQRMFNRINFHSKYAQSGNYIRKIFSQLDVKESDMIAYQMETIYGMTENDILCGKNDDIIKKRVRYYLAKKNSEDPSLFEGYLVDKTVDEIPKVEVPVETKKKTVDKSFYKKAILTLLSVALVVSIAAPAVKKSVEANKYEEKVMTSINMLAANTNSDKYEQREGIVSRNSYRVGTDDRGFPINAYWNDKIAKDIIKVAKEDPNLFDLTMYSVYFSMEERLDNMDEVMDYLKMFTKEDESLSFIYNQIDDCDVFLDYVMKKGFVSPNSKEYYDLKNDIEIFKNVGSFKSLSGESQERILELMEEYLNYKKYLVEEYKNNSKVVYEVSDSYGGR